MRTVRRLLHTEVLAAVSFVTVAFLALFFFFDFVDELADVGKAGYSIGAAALYCLLELPGHFYELFPIAVLIGSIFAMARLAQSSEFTILRTGGLGPRRALGLLGGLGLGFAVITLIVGDVVAPASDQIAVTVRAKASGKLPIARGGAWLKDRRLAPPTQSPPGERFDSIHVARLGSDGRLEQVRLYEFDAGGALLTRLEAQRARVGGGRWQFEDVRRTRWLPGADGGAPVDERLATLDWPSSLTPEVVAAAVSPVSSMSTLNLFRYMTHLSDNEQAAQRHEIQFWKKAMYPLACLVMMGLALPFAYLHARGGGVSLKVFGGILLGISFVLLNNVSTHLGLLQNWTPWLAAAAPSAVYLLLSLAAFSWLVKYR